MYSIQMICEYVQGVSEGSGDHMINRINGIEDAVEGEISFVLQPKFSKYLNITKASAVLIPEKMEVHGDIVPVLIRVPDIQNSYLKLLGLFEPEEIFDSAKKGFNYISESAKIHESVKIGNFAHISAGTEIGENTVIAPQVFLGKNVKIGKNVKVYPGVKIYRNCEVGDNCILHANAVIGSDGFGFVKKKEEGYQKIPQIGNVIIESDVEIGANTVIDRSTFSSTRIGKGVKLDNLIQIAHNVTIGDHTVMASQTGVAGSVTIGDNCVIGGQSAFVPHIRVASGSQFQGKSAVGKSILEPNGRYSGIPAIPFNDYLRSYSVFKILPELEKKLRNLENEMNQLKKDK